MKHATKMNMQFEHINWQQRRDLQNLIAVRDPKGSARRVCHYSLFIVILNRSYIVLQPQVLSTLQDIKKVSSAGNYVE
jgi:hypothetical protein